MSKIKANRAAREIAAWLPNMSDEGRAAMMDTIGRGLASLRGGEEAEQAGYDAFPHLDFQEIGMIGDLFAALETPDAVRSATAIILKGASLENPCGEKSASSEEADDAVENPDDEVSVEECAECGTDLSSSEFINETDDGEFLCDDCADEELVD